MSVSYATSMSIFYSMSSLKKTVNNDSNYFLSIVSSPLISIRLKRSPTSSSKGDSPPSNFIMEAMTFPNYPLENNLLPSVSYWLKILSRIEGMSSRVNFLGFWLLLLLFSERELEDMEGNLDVLLIWDINISQLNWISFKCSKSFEKASGKFSGRLRWSKRQLFVIIIHILCKLFNFQYVLDKIALNLKRGRRIFKVLQNE